MKLHILLTSVGRRGYLVKYFKDALGDEGKIYAANSIKCSAFVYADQTVITPLIYDEKDIKFLKDYCIYNNTILLSYRHAYGSWLSRKAALLFFYDIELNCPLLPPK